MAYATDMATFNTKMTALADSIREKAEVSGLKTLDQMKEAVDNIIFYTYYEGTTAPSNTLGKNGDIYMMY